MTSDNQHSHDDRVADVAAALDAIADELAQSAGTGDGIIPPPGSPEDIEFERQLDELVAQDRRRTAAEAQAAMDFATGALGAAGRTLDPKVLPIARDFAAGKISGDEYRQLTGLDQYESNDDD